MSSSNEGWDEYRRLILSELERIDGAVKDCDHDNSSEINKLLVDVTKLREDVVALKVKAGIWGILGGVITTLGAIMLKFV